jgi:hypothetical protein
MSGIVTCRQSARPESDVMVTDRKVRVAKDSAIFTRGLFSPVLDATHAGCATVIVDQRSVFE